MTKFWIEERDRVSGDWKRQSHQYYAEKQRAEWCVDTMVAWGNTYDCLRIIKDDQHSPESPEQLEALEAYNKKQVN